MRCDRTCLPGQSLPQRQGSDLRPHLILEHVCIKKFVSSVTSSIVSKWVNVRVRVTHSRNVFLGLLISHPLEEFLLSFVDLLVCVYAPAMNVERTGDEVMIPRVRLRLKLSQKRTTSSAMSWFQSSLRPLRTTVRIRAGSVTSSVRSVRRKHSGTSRGTRKIRSCTFCSKPIIPTWNYRMRRARRTNILKSRTPNGESAHSAVQSSMGNRERVQADQALPSPGNLDEVRVSLLQLPVRLHHVQRLAVSGPPGEDRIVGRV